MAKKWIFRKTGRPPSNNKIYHFGSWLKTTLHSNKITIKSFAEQTGIDAANLYNYVRGRSLPSMTIYIYIIEGMARVTGKNENDMLKQSFHKIKKDI
jgi:transcriptional regulator with XRE-family HTH domain